MLSENLMEVLESIKPKTTKNEVEFDDSNKFCCEGCLDTCEGACADTTVIEEGCGYSVWDISDCGYSAFDLPDCGYNASEKLWDLPD